MADYNLDAPHEDLEKLHSPHTEDALIAAVIINPANYELISLEPGHFYNRHNRIIWKAIQSLVDAGLPIDYVTVCQELDKTDKLQDIEKDGSKGYAAITAMLATGGSQNAEGYAYKIRDLATRRQAANLARQLSRSAFNQDAPLDLEGITDKFSKLVSEPTGITDTWDIKSLDDAYQPRPPTRYVVQDILPIPSVNIIYGPPSSLKSFLLMDLLTCISAGIDWLIPAAGGYGYKTTEAPSLWIDFDNGPDLVQERIAALARHRRLDTSQSLYYVSMPTPWLDAGSKASIAALAQRIKRLDCRMVVIDNLGTIKGEADENTDQMIPVMSNLRWLATECDICLVLIHHSNKTQQNGARPGNKLRGHSSIEASLDNAIYIDRNGTAPVVTLEGTKSRRKLMPVISAEFAHSNDDNNDIYTAAFYGIDTTRTKHMLAIEKQIIYLLTKEPMNQLQLIKALQASMTDSVGEKRIRDILASLVNTGKLTTSKGDKNSTVYELGIIE